LDNKVLLLLMHGVTIKIISQMLTTSLKMVIVGRNM